MNEALEERRESVMRVYDRGGDRLYLNESERARFIESALSRSNPKRQLALTLAFSGCRLSEARHLRIADLQPERQVLSIRTLKRRRVGVVREVPIPKLLVEELCSIEVNNTGLLWSINERPISRITAYRWIKEVMQSADVTGKKASPKGLRHGFGVHATLSGIQLHMLCRWMGHASVETTAIYATVVGREEIALASKMWSS